MIDCVMFIISFHIIKINQFLFIFTFKYKFVVAFRSAFYSTHSSFEFTWFVALGPADQKELTSLISFTSTGTFDQWRAYNFTTKQASVRKHVACILIFFLTFPRVNDMIFPPEACEFNFRSFSSKMINRAQTRTRSVKEIYGIVWHLLHSNHVFSMTNVAHFKTFCIIKK